MQVFAGTDAGGVLPHGLIGDEVRELVDYGLTPSTRSVRRRGGPASWLGLDDNLAEGTTADFVVFDRDPLADLGVLREPGADGAARPRGGLGPERADTARRGR